MGDPLVSTVMAFVNEERFLREAIESVFAQTYSNWELVLVDDGSTDSSERIARSYAQSHPGKVRYFEHSNHKNCGVSASRNLGLDYAKGKYVTFLDGDDVWMPLKLERQVEIMEAQPLTGMVCGDTQWWFSWTGDPHDLQRDYTPSAGVQANTLIQPPALLTMFLNGEARVPCTCSVLFRRELLETAGNFDESFRIYEDQAFYAKLCAQTPVFVAAECWSKYRQHPNSACATAKHKGERDDTRLRYLKWLEEYLSEQNIVDPALWRALKNKQFRHNHPSLNRAIKAWNRMVNPASK